MRFIFIFFLLNNCSLNNDSKYWTEESINLNEENIIKINNQKKLPKILEKSDDITTMTLEEYEIFIDDYTKKSKYPDISQ
jgi:hypothetical protein